jgi:hypothetical protein
MNDLDAYQGIFNISKLEIREVNRPPLLKKAPQGGIATHGSQLAFNNGGSQKRVSECIHSNPYRNFGICKVVPQEA